MTELPHRTYTPWSERVYWNGNVAGHAENATRVMVKVHLGALSNQSGTARAIQNERLACLQNQSAESRGEM